MNPAPHSAWPHLTAAARAARTAAAAREEEAPYGFSTRVVSRWRQAQEADRRLALWQRLSWRAAFASLALCAVVAVSQRSRPGAAEGVLLEPPALSFPTL